MRGTKDKKTGGMNLRKPKISLVLIFTIILSIFMLQGWIGLKSADAMPLVKKGTIVKNTATGAQAVTGVGFQPKAVVFWWTRQNTFNANNAGISTGYGYAAALPTITQGSVAAAARDNLATTDNNFMESITYSIVILNPGATGTPMVARASVTAFGADGFTLNWQTNEAQANQIHYMAIGGADITDARVGTFAGPAVAGSAAVTGVGFQPDAVLFVAGNRTGVTWDTIVAEGAQTIGFMSSATSQASIGWSARDAQTALSNAHAWSGAQAITGLRRNALDQQAAFTSMDADGFTLNFTQTGGASNYIYLALKGGLFKMGTFNKNTAAGAQSVTGLGFQPSGLMLLSESDNVAAATARASANPASNLSIGATDGTTSGSTWMHYRSIATTDTNTFTYNTNIMKMGINTNATVTNYGEATFTSFNTDGFTINWTTSDATARNLIYWAIGGVLGDSVNVADGTDPANANAGRGSTNNIADSFTMVAVNTLDGLADVTGVTSSFTNSANISGVRLYKDNGVAGTYEPGTDTLLSTGTPGASVSFTGFTENLTTTAANYLILVDIAGGATLAQTIDTSVTAVTVTSPDVQGTISDASNPTRLTIIDLPHEDAGTASNTAIAASPQLEGGTGILMQRFQVSSATSSAGAQDNQLELNSLGIDDLGTATGARTAKAYIDTTSSATLPGTAVLIGTLSSWTGAPTTITLNQGTAGDRTVTNATPRYIYIVYDLPAGATQTVQSSITSVGAVSPDAGQTGLTLNSNAITLSADPSTITSCAGCHGYGATLTDGTARNVPDGKFPGSHNKHVNTYGKACSVCHAVPATETGANYTHRNNTIEMSGSINGTSGAVYVKGTSWTQTTIPAAYTGCTNTYCHSSGVGVLSGTIPSNTSITWGTTATCGSCHGTALDDGRPNYTNNSPKRNTHGDGASYGVTHKATACTTCHTGVSGTAGSYTVDPATHNNGVYNLSGTFGYTQATGTCSTPGCHGSSTWGTSLGCVDCHASAQGTRSIITGASGEFGLAWGHKKSARGTVTDADCIVCHLEGAYTSGVGSAVAKTAYHSGAPNGNIDLRDPDGAGETAITNNSGGAFTFTKYSISYAAGSRTTTLGNTIPEVITVKFCMKCHDSNGATNTTARSNNGGTGTATQPFGGISTGYSVINGAAAVNGLIDVSTQFAAANSSRHPVGAPNSRRYPYSTRLASPYNNIGTTRDANTQVGNTATPRVAANSVVLVCDDCHTVTTAAGSLPSLTNRTITAHGTAQTDNVRGTFMVATPVLCLSCHGGTTTPNTTTAQIDTTNGDHNPGSAYAVGTTRVNSFISNCGYCHFSALTTPVRPIKAQDIHGFNGMQTTGAAWAWGTISGMRPVAFMRNVANFATASPRPYSATLAGPGQFTLAGGQSSCAGTGDLTNGSCSGQTGKHTPYSPGGSY